MHQPAGRLLLCVLIMSSLAGCTAAGVLRAPQTSSRQVPPEVVCDSAVSAEARAACVASCRLGGAACPQGPSLLERMRPDLTAQAERGARQAQVHFQAGLPHQGLREVTQARAAWTLAGHTWRAARLIPLQAQLLLELGRPAEALTLSESGLTILSGTGDALDVMVLHLIRGLARLQLGDSPGALAEFADASALRAALEDRPGLDEAQLLYARLAMRLGLMMDAARALDGLVPEPEAPRLKAAVHRSRGELHHHRGELAAALGEHALALSIERRAEHRPEVVRELLILSRLFAELGRLDVAWRLGVYGASLAESESLHTEAAQAQVALGRLAEEFDAPQDAARRYLSALNQWPTALPVGSSERFWALTGLWRLCASGGCGPRTILLPPLPGALGDLGDVEVSFDVDGGLEVAQGARGSSASLSKTPLTPDTLLASAMVARVWLARGERVAARRLLRNIETVLTLPLPVTTAWRVHHEVGLTWREIGQPGPAREHIAEAVSLLEGLRQSLDVEGLRRGWSYDHREVYSDYMDLHVGVSSPPPTSLDTERALVAAERVKARGVTELIRQAQGETLPGTAQEASLGRAVRHHRVAQALVESMEEAAPWSALQPSDARVEGAPVAAAVGESVWDVVPQVAKLCEVWSGLRWSPEDVTDQPAQMDFEALPSEIQASLPVNAALLSYIVGPTQTYLWVIRHEEITFHHLAGEQVLTKAVERHMRAMLKLRFANRAERQEHARAARALAELTLSAALPSLRGVERLIIAPDGPLRAVPFSTLVMSDRRRGGVPDYLVRQAALTHVPSAAAWWVLTRRAPSVWRSPSSAGRFVALGDPVHAQRASGEDALQVHVEFHDGGVTFVTDAPALGSLPSLKHSRRELERIAALVGAERAHLLMGGAATEAALLGSPLEQARYLHFATHGLTDVTPLLPPSMMAHLSQPGDARLRQAEPALVLSRSAGDADDGLLKIGEILELTLSADLVVLSACSTGRGWQAMGGAAYGLGGAFLVAGARRAVASLWSVGDRSTSALMVALYRGLEQGFAPDEALRRAQLRVLMGEARGLPQTRGVAAVTDDAPPERRSSRHTRSAVTPFHWAPFVVIGD